MIFSGIMGNHKDLTCILVKDYQLLDVMRILGTALAITGKCVERSGARRPKGLGTTIHRSNMSEVMCHEVHCLDELIDDSGAVWKSCLDRRKSRMDGIIQKGPAV